jgi:hypothetical protein
LDLYRATEQFYQILSGIYVCAYQITADGWTKEYQISATPAVPDTVTKFNAASNGSGSSQCSVNRTPPLGIAIVTVGRMIAGEVAPSSILTTHAVPALLHEITN